MVYKSTHNDIHDSMKRYKSIYKTIVGTKDQSVKIGSIRSWDGGPESTELFRVFEWRSLYSSSTGSLYDV